MVYMYICYHLFDSFSHSFLIYCSNCVGGNVICTADLCGKYYSRANTLCTDDPRGK